MTGERVLITGGAGFIGSHTADALLRRGCTVRVLDNLHPQVHGQSGHPPAYLSPQIELLKGDVRDRTAVEVALEGVQVVYHFAAETGVGQSMTEPARYVDVNVRGTAVLWEGLAARRDTVRHLILASSRAVYGEGLYRCPQDGPVFPPGRDPADLARHIWSMKCPICGQPVESLPTPEDAVLSPASIYAQTKKFQEEMCRLMGQVHGIPVTVLRYFNVYGSRQALTNPYTGVIATFITRLLNGKPIELYEEGLPRRDFVHVTDVVRANLAALDRDTAAPFEVFNVGTGLSLTLRAVAESVCRVMGREPHIVVGFKHRVGDILSCIADLSRSRAGLGYEPQVAFEEGLLELLTWLGDQKPPDRSDTAAAELQAKGLMIDG